MLNRAMILGAAVAVALTQSVTDAAWVPISVPNHSFELGNGITTDGGWGTAGFNPTTDPPVDNVNDVLTGWVLHIPTWTHAGRTNPNDQVYSGSTDPNPIPTPGDATECAFIHWGYHGLGSWPEGSRAAYIKSYQPVATIQADTTYRLTVAVGRHNCPYTTAQPGPDHWSNVDTASIALLADEAAVSLRTVQVNDLGPQGYFYDVLTFLTAEHIAANNLVGKELKVRLSAYNTNGDLKVHANFDNVRLEVPEPATLSLLCVGGILLLKCRRRSKA
ncbi:MAG: PEP-CTERM sorting domain-containing protein [Planctomycetota bacterium]